MPSVSKSRIIVLHLTKHSDSAVVVHTVDSAEGRRSYLVRGASPKSGGGRGGSSRAGGMQAFHCLSILDAVSGQAPKSTLCFLKEWEPAFDLSAIRSDMVKASVAMFISEVIYRSLTAEVAEPDLFDWLCDAIVALNATEGPVANFHLWFLVSYCTKMGFRPGETLEPRGLFSPEEEALLYKVLRSPFEEAMMLPLSAEKRQNFCRRMLRYLSYHLGAEIDARSLDVLHEIFS